MILFYFMTLQNRLFYYKNVNDILIQHACHRILQYSSWMFQFDLVVRKFIWTCHSNIYLTNTKGPIMKGGNGGPPPNTVTIKNRGSNTVNVKNRGQIWLC